MFFFFDSGIAMMVIVTTVMIVMKMMMTMMMKMVAVIYPNTIYGVQMTMRMQKMIKKKNRIKNIQVHRPVRLRPVPNLLVEHPVQLPDQNDIREKNRVVIVNEIVEGHTHVHVHVHVHDLVPEIAVADHHIIRAPDLAVDPNRPTNDMYPVNIVAKILSIE